MSASPLLSSSPPPALGDILSRAESGVGEVPGPLPQAELSGLLRAALEEPILLVRIDQDPCFVEATPQVRAYLDAVAAVLRDSVQETRAAIATAIASTAAWMPLAPADLGLKRAELQQRHAITDVQGGGTPALLAAATTLGGAREMAEHLAREVPEKVIAIVKEDVVRFQRRLAETQGGIRRIQIWATASRDASRALVWLDSLAHDDGTQVVQRIEDVRRLLSSHRDTIDLMEQEEAERVRTESRERERRLREDHTLLFAARSQVSRINITLLASVSLLVLLLALSRSHLFLLSITPALLGILTARQGMNTIRDRVWTLSRDDVDDAFHDLQIRQTLLMMFLLVVGLVILVMGALAVVSE